MSAAPRNRQRGVVMIVGLVVLVLLSLLALESMRTATLEERMTGNTEDREIAFQIAEAALREAEDLLGQPMLPAFVAVGDPAAAGYYLADPPSPGSATVPIWLRPAGSAGAPVWRASAVTADAPPAPIDRARAEFIIEQLESAEEATPGASLQADVAADSRERIIYRITARAWGAATVGQPAPSVLLQSTFKR